MKITEKSNTVITLEQDNKGHILFSIIFNPTIVAFSYLFFIQKLPSLTDFLVLFVLILISTILLLMFRSLKHTVMIDKTTGIVESRQIYIYRTGNSIYKLGDIQKISLKNEFNMLEVAYGFTHFILRFESTNNQSLKIIITKTLHNDKEHLMQSIKTISEFLAIPYEMKP